jgi:predicted thioesterase
MSVPVGIEHVIRRTVTADMTPPHLLPTVVLSTPKMIELMETVCLEAAAPHLGDDQTTVGVAVNVTHETAAREGEEVEFRCRLAQVDRRRLHFEVEATSGGRVIGRGTHDRFVVERSRFGS